MTLWSALSRRQFVRIAALLPSVAWMPACRPQSRAGRNGLDARPTSWTQHEGWIISADEKRTLPVAPIGCRDWLDRTDAR